MVHAGKCNQSSLGTWELDAPGDSAHAMGDKGATMAELAGLRVIARMDGGGREGRGCVEAEATPTEPIERHRTMSARGFH